eukprot:12426847-Prorocentrum_lima.AAC.1
MTSSLVGSEMCIRDSLCHVPLFAVAFSWLTSVHRVCSFVVPLFRHSWVACWLLEEGLSLLGCVALVLVD